MADLHEEFTALYRRHAADVYRFALYLARDAATADEIASETFVRAWLSPGEIREETVTRYLFAITRNLYLKSLQRARRHEELAEDVADTALNPLERAIVRDDVESVAEQIMTLPDVDRRALLMRAVDGMPYEDIARELAITVVAAKVKVHRARLRLHTLR